MSADRWWLTPGATYTPEAEAALELCAGLMSKTNPDPEDADRAWTQLRLHVADTDPFWLNWRAWRRMAGFPVRGTPSTETQEDAKAIGIACAARWRDIQSQRNGTAETPAIGAPVTAPAESDE